MADKQWRVLSIFHTGTKGGRGEERVDDLYPERKERIFVIDPDKIEIGRSLFMECAGNYLKSMITSPVMSYKAKGDRLRFRTVNSVYILERLGDLDVNN